MTNENERCGQCTYYYALPGDPTNLGAPKVGVCRARPPVPVVMGNVRTIRGQGVNIQMLHTQVTAETPCCGLYEGRLQLTIKN